MSDSAPNNINANGTTNGVTPGLPAPNQNNLEIGGMLNEGTPVLSTTTIIATSSTVRIVNGHTNPNNHPHQVADTTAPSTPSDLEEVAVLLNGVIQRVDRLRPRNDFQEVTILLTRLNLMLENIRNPSRATSQRPAPGANVPVSLSENLNWLSHAIRVQDQNSQQRVQESHAGVTSHLNSTMSELARTIRRHVDVRVRQLHTSLNTSNEAEYNALTEELRSIVRGVVAEIQGVREEVRQVREEVRGIHEEVRGIHEEVRGVRDNLAALMARMGIDRAPN